MWLYMWENKGMKGTNVCMFTSICKYMYFYIAYKIYIVCSTMWWLHAWEISCY